MKIQNNPDSLKTKKLDTLKFRKEQMQLKYNTKRLDILFDSIGVQDTIV